MTDRNQYITGLRKLADLLDTHDDLPVPTHGDVKWLLFDLTGSSEAKSDESAARQKQLAATIVRRLGGIRKPSDPDGLYRMSGKLGGPNGLGVDVTVNRAAVCERVVTGTHVETKTVPDPAVIVPLIDVEETVEDIEWVCLPLLADVTAS